MWRRLWVCWTRAWTVNLRTKVEICISTYSNAERSGWSYDKTYEARSFVRHWDMMTLKMSHSGCASCDIFNLGFIIFQCPLTTVRNLYDVSNADTAKIIVEILVDQKIIKFLAKSLWTTEVIRWLSVFISSWVGNLNSFNSNWQEIK